MAAPKIFFALNQQADPDPSVYVGALRRLMNRLDEESELMDLEGRGDAKRVLAGAQAPAEFL